MIFALCVPKSEVSNSHVEEMVIYSCLIRVCVADDVDFQIL